MAATDTLGILRGAGTATLLLSFVALCFWAWSPAELPFTEGTAELPFTEGAAELPFLDDAPPVRRRETR